MIDDLKSIAMFVETIKCGSFRGAAKSLSVSPSAISYNVAELEKKLGTTLIYRTTRSLSLTTQGESLYQHGTDMIACYQRGVLEVRPTEGVLKGKLRLTVTSALIESELNQQLCHFANQHPDVSLDIRYTDTQENIIEKRIDLAIRAGKLADSNLRSRRIGHIKRVLVCSPDYLAKKSLPSHPDELSKWDWVSLSMMPKERTFTHQFQAPETVNTGGRICVNSVVAMTQLCHSGGGLATPPESMARSSILDGGLVELLKEWSVEAIPYYAIWPNNVTPNRLTKCLVKFLTEKNVSAP